MVKGCFYRFTNGFHRRINKGITPGSRYVSWMSYKQHDFVIKLTQLTSGCRYTCMFTHWSSSVSQSAAPDPDTSPYHAVYRSPNLLPATKYKQQ